jgi:predicted nucleic acid-binding protein
MTIVLDTSAAAEIVLNRLPGIHLQKFIGSAEKVYSTDLFKAEITNTLWKYTAGELLSMEQAVKLIGLAFGLVDEFVDIQENVIEALHEGVSRNRPVYDMLYMTLARRTGSMLLTMDRQLAESARDTDIAVAP